MKSPTYDLSDAQSGDTHPGGIAAAPTAATYSIASRVASYSRSDATPSGWTSPGICSYFVHMTDVDGTWRNASWDEAIKDIWTLQCGPLYSIELVRRPLHGSGRPGPYWQGQVNGTLVAHADLEKAKAKVDWLIWNELRVSADAYRRIRERVKAPGFKYDGSW